MAPVRKTRGVNKQFPYSNEVFPNKNKQKKRKLSDMLGPQWTTEELKRFYEAYRTYGRNWKEVASAVGHRSVENVEALYTMNRAYLSLPEGTASVIGLTAMMCDYYSMLDRSDSEQESIDGAGTSRKHRKLSVGKFQSNASRGLKGHISDLSQSQSMASDGCLSLLKNRHTGIRSHAVKKRTPRVPVPSYDKDNSRKYFSLARQGLKIDTDANDGYATREVAFALTEASKRVGSPQVSRTPKRKAKGSTPSPVRNGERMTAETKRTTARPHSREMDEGGFEPNLGSKLVDYDAKGFYLKKKKVEENKTSYFENLNEDSSGTEEEQYKLGTVKGKVGTKVDSAKKASTFYKDRKKAKKDIVEEDADTSFDALLTLADLSLMMPEATANLESSAHGNEESFNTANKFKLEEGVHQFNTGMQRRKQKSPVKLQIHENKTGTDFPWSDNQIIETANETKNYGNKGKRSSHYNTHQKQGKLTKPIGDLSSTTDHKRQESSSDISAVEVQHAFQATLPLKDRSKVKVDIQKDTKSSQSTSSDQPNRPIIKGELSNCLSRHQARRWCAFEWFYSAIDYPWFAKREFVDYLNHVGLGDVPRLTRVEWGVIKNSLGRPRRFSEKFLKEEKEKLNQYRESVRKYYTELYAGTREGLPADLARPFLVGQRVISFHPKTREIHNGIVLNVDHNRCCVQFDQPELGLEYIMDIDCMPLNPVENLPVSFIKPKVTVNKYSENFKQLEINEQEKEGKTMNIVSSDNLDSTDVPCNVPLTHHINKSSKLIEIQAKEADVRALLELTRALEKKDAVVSELRYMNDEVFEGCSDGDNSIKDSEPFKKEYAAVLLQLSAVNDQVSTALYCLRQRNTYKGSYPLISVKPMAVLSDPGGNSSPSCHVQESASHVYEIVEISKAKARKMVDVAMQAFVSSKRENKVERIQEVIDIVSQKVSEDDVSRQSPIKGSSPIMVSQDQSIACTSNPLEMSCASDPNSNNVFKQSEDKVLSELIANCIAALFMIQTCTARQFSPADVARVLDHAVTNLKPKCTQNLSLYGEIQKCMGIIRSQILALVPTYVHTA